jgi:hypothetical protein
MDARELKSLRLKSRSFNQGKAVAFSNTSTTLFS